LDLKDEFISESVLSANKKQIGFVVRGEVFILDIETQKTRQITESAADEFGICFSSDNERIFYSSEYYKWQN